MLDDPHSGTIDINALIKVVEKGGTVRTGVDIYNKSGVLLLEKSVAVSQVRPLRIIKESGIKTVPISRGNSGGVWDKSGKSISDVPRVADESRIATKTAPKGNIENLQKRILEISEIKREAARKYQVAKGAIKEVLSQIKNSGGDFDYVTVESTVTDLLAFMTRHENSFAYLTREIFSYDEYLYNHSINVCTIGAAVLSKYNRKVAESSNHFYLADQIKDIASGYFLHDVGKINISDKILNKPAPLNPSEYEQIKRHSFEKGAEILANSRIQNAYVENVVKYHHGPLYQEEPNSYPEPLSPDEVPAYVKICKLVDIYDAMTSRRCYKAAHNPVAVVTDIFREYAGKNPSLQLILYSFIKSVGIYPAGSVVWLKNGQMAYVLDSKGPVLMCFTDSYGGMLKNKPEPIDMANPAGIYGNLAIDMEKPLIQPEQAYSRFPSYLKAYLGKSP